MAIDKMNPAQAANAYANVQKTAISSGGSDETADAGGPSFGDLIRKATSDSIQTMKGGEKASASAITGKAELSDVVQAVTNAELTLQTVVAVRDRMLSSYQSIMNMPM